jgi:hypothetical protein
MIMCNTAGTMATILSYTESPPPGDTSILVRAMNKSMENQSDQWHLKECSALLYPNLYVNRLKESLQLSMSLPPSVLHGSTSSTCSLSAPHRQGVRWRSVLVPWFFCKLIVRHFHFLLTRPSTRSKVAHFICPKAWQATLPWNSLICCFKAPSLHWTKYMAW